MMALNDKYINKQNPVIKTYDFSVWFFEETGPLLIQKERYDDMDENPLRVRALFTYSSGKVSIDMALNFSNEEEEAVADRDVWFEDLTEEKVKVFLKRCFPTVFKKEGINEKS